MRLTLDQVERELAKLWETDAPTAGGSRTELMTLVALVSEQACSSGRSRSCPRS